MAQQNINIGSSANKGDGDPIRTAFSKAENNFTDLYTRLIVNHASSTVTANTLVGNLTGSVFADNSTLLVDGVNGNIPGYVSIASLKTEVAASTDFADFKTRIAAL